MYRILTVFFASLMLALAVTYAHGQEITAPLYCQPDVITSLKTIWQESGNGTTGIEATFIVSGADGFYSIDIMPHTNEKDKQTVYVYNTTFALFHIHPNNSGAYPSTPSNNIAGNGLGDTGWADKDHFDIYAASSRGLTVYYWQTKKMTILRGGLTWMSQKGCK